MNLRSIDLNLLVVLDALLDEAHVSRAAVRLNLSQPAVSAALQRCRDMFHDPLLERGRGLMRRTAKAEAMRAPLKSILVELEALLDPPPPVLSEIRRTLRITTADDPAAFLLGPLTAALAQSAPGVSLIIRPWQGADAAVQDLLNGDTDLAISVFEEAIEGIDTQTLLEESYVVAMRRGHPAASTFGLDTWLDWPHVLVSGRGGTRSPVDDRLKSLGRTRRVGTTVPSFHLVPAILKTSDHIALVPSLSLALHGGETLIALTPPIDVAGFPLHLAWHARNADDIVLRFVRDQADDIFKSLAAARRP